MLPTIKEAKKELEIASKLNPGPWVKHSLNVCKAALSIRKSMIELDDTLLEELPKDSVIIASLLHDTCKADIYKPTMKKEKNR